MKGKQVYILTFRMPKPSSSTKATWKKSKNTGDVSQINYTRGMKSDPKVFIPIFLISPIPFVTFTPPNISPVLYHIYTYKYVYHCQDL